MGPQLIALRRGPAAPRPATPVDADALEKALRARLAGEVRFSPGDRALYATDGSNYRQVPIGVVVPRTVDDVVVTVEECRRHGAPLLSRGGGTSLAGQCCNVAVVIDWSKYLNQLVSLDPAARRAVVQPGLVLDRLRERANLSGLTFAPDPSTHAYCTLGGMIGNNSCGVHSIIGRPHRRQRRVARDPHLRRRAPARRRHQRRRARALVRLRRARRARSTAIYARSAIATRGSSAPAFPRSRAASPATPSTSSYPSAASTSRARSSAPRAPASPCSRPRCAWCRGPSIARSSCSATRASTKRPITSSRSCESGCIGLEGLDDASSTT